ncbi:MAG: hypothetical protein WCW16_03775 [Candidatus Magasanikbacteria bacterium]
MKYTKSLFLLIALFFVTVLFIYLYSQKDGRLFLNNNRCLQYGRGWQEYKVDDLNSSFCYDQQWGSAQVNERDDSAIIKIVFNDISQQWIGIFFSSISNRFSQFDTGNVICWDCINFQESATALKMETFPTSTAQNFSFKKIRVDDRDVLKTVSDYASASGTVDSYIEYYMPFFLEKTGYHVYVYASSDLELEAEKMVNSFLLQ